MSTSSNSSHHKLLDAMDTLHHCLSDPNCIVPDHNRIKLITTFHDIKRQLHSSLTHLDSTNSNNTTDNNDNNNQLYSLKNEVSELLNMFNISTVSQPKIDPPPSDELDPELKSALLCFSLFGEAVAMKKRDVVYWWVGQGLIDDVEDGEDTEKAADVILNKLIDAGAIKQVVNSKRQMTSNKYKLAMKIFNEDFRNVGLLRKLGTKFIVCDLNDANVDENSRAFMETLFNPCVSILTIRRDWLRKMRHLKVLHLGRWSSDPEQHIEVEKLEFLEGLKYLKEMRFISFKGISRIMELGNDICQLGNLRVLDLQACPNLEVLPKRIGMLTNLTHLDVSKCYLLDRIPKGITSLTKLQVLEGFVIGDVHSSSSCKFKDLANHLGTNLKTLSIRTRKLSFPNENDLQAFSKFEKLLKLKIVWVKTSESDDEEEDESSLQRTQEATINTQASLKSRSFVRNLTTTFRGEPHPSRLPEQLQQLEVQAIPQKAMKSLMLRDNGRLINLHKLCVIGGELSDLTDQGKIKWTHIKTLRLKHLTRLHMNWRQFKDSFPCVTYLEVTRCPYLSFFPCDYHGIWRQTEEV